jgi:hypothetical protein
MTARTKEEYALLSGVAIFLIILAIVSYYFMPLVLFGFVIIFAWSAITGGLGSPA